MTEIDDLRLSLNEIYKHLGVSQVNVYKWIEKHDMPVHCIYWLWNFKEDDVDVWINAGSAVENEKKNSDDEDHR